MAVTEKQKQEVRQLLIEGRKIEAIKYIRQHFNLDLRQSKTLVEHVEADIEPWEFKKASRSAPTKPLKAGCAGKSIALIFGSIGMIMLSIAFYIFYTDAQQIDRSELVIGTVVSNPSQPTIEYQFNGETYNYYSTVQSNPPSYDMGEEVEVYVDTENPNNAIINTITERWFSIIILGIIGAVFSGVAFLTNRLI
ncbi:DUF3592 domain-containing protein [Fulvivirga lutimaris]|uniref:DUF3592 domain-containing protein n=1 Tax=Fulvivirga lutimaris TaxID=1819566 RepID=UPI0012BC95D8|nr:DUF3592 domain-containing protein [Fulvivirga lutimaris]MTI39771.1 DUF3592 domain-containing protein [Fulvivirga lutimaris]